MMNKKIFNFDSIEMKNYDLIVDAIYEGGTAGNTADDVMANILKVSNSGGFRHKIGGQYLVLYSSQQEEEWPDFFDSKTGVFTYYGDNKDPKKQFNKTKGNKILEKIDFYLNYDENPREKINPIFVFKKAETLTSKRSVKFVGLAVPGSSYDQEFLTVEKKITLKGEFYYNFVAKFTILDEKVISREWINSLENDRNISTLAPVSYLNWKTNGEYKSI